MDIEFEKIIDIKRNNNEEIGTVPRSLNTDELREFAKELVSFYRKFTIACIDDDKNDAIFNLNEMIYLCFDYMARIGVYPGGLIQSIVNAQLYRIIDDKIHFDHYGRVAPPGTTLYYNYVTAKIKYDANIEKKQSEFKLNPSTISKSAILPICITEVYNDINTSITEMELGIYNKIDNNNEYVGDLGKLYNAIRAVNKKFNFPHANSASVLSTTRLEHFKLTLDSLIDDFYDYSQRITPYAFYLSDIICIITNIFVEMGINPKEYFDAYLDDKKENKKHR